MSGMINDVLANATHAMPPCVSGPHIFTEVATTAGSNTTGTSGAATSPGWYTFAVSGAFNIVFHSSSTITNPTNSSVFPAGVHNFYLTENMNYFELMPAANGYYMWWKSSQGKE